MLALIIQKVHQASESDLSRTIRIGVALDTKPCPGNINISEIISSVTIGFNLNTSNKLQKI